MLTDRKILVFAGAREAHGVVAGLLARGRSVIASLVEEERMFDALPVPMRIGHFSDHAALDAWITAQGVACVIDASHGFDARISSMAAQVCARLALPYCRVLRPQWQATAQDRWVSFATVRAAVDAVVPAARVFTNTGRGTLCDYAECRAGLVTMRLTHPTTEASPFPFLKFLSGTPPFSVRAEETLFRDLAITLLICRNVGGAASKSKLLAARTLGIEVSMIERPAPPPGVPVMQDVAEALAWEAQL